MTAPSPDPVLADDASGDLFVDLPAGPRICYRVEGPADGVPLLLIAGLGIDLTSWPQRMVDGFVELTTDLARSAGAHLAGDPR